MKPIENINYRIYDPDDLMPGITVKRAHYTGDQTYLILSRAYKKMTFGDKMSNVFDCQAVSSEFTDDTIRTQYVSDLFRCPVYIINSPNEHLPADLFDI